MQAVVLEDIVLARLVTKGMPDILREDEALQPFGKQTLLLEWKHALRMIGLGDSGLLPAGLRGGGATEWQLRHMNVPQLRQRHRWSSERTLERYLQKALYHRPFVEALNDWHRITRPSQLARTILSRSPGWLG